ncbi:unnamed protein product, partial [Mesocestoides corti]
MNNSEMEPCPFCSKKVLNEEEFFVHVVSCSGESSTPTAVSKSASRQVPIASMSQNSAIHLPAPEASLPWPSSGSAPAPPKRLEPVKAAAVAALNRNPPQVPRATEVGSCESGDWKCVLCKLSFRDKSLLMAHIRSSEHTEKIRLTGCSIESPKTPTVPPPTQSAKVNPMPNTSEPGVMGSGLAEMVRVIVKEELGKIVRAELRK